MGKEPTLRDLQRPEKLEDILALDREDDCLSCKVIGNISLISISISVVVDFKLSIFCLHLLHLLLPVLTLFPGSGAFFGLAMFTYFDGRAKLRAQEAKIIASKSPFGMRSRHGALIALSLGLGYMGIWRWTH